MNEAIILAIEKGGYRHHIAAFQSTIALDPLFWQALANALAARYEVGSYEYESIRQDWEKNAERYLHIRMRAVVQNGAAEDTFWKELLMR